MSNYQYGWQQYITLQCGATPTTIEHGPIGVRPLRIDGYNLTNAGNSGATAMVKKFTWLDADPGSTYIVKNATGGASDESSKITTDGITVLGNSSAYINRLNGFTNANPAVLTVSGDLSSRFTVGSKIEIRGYVGPYQADKTLPNGKYTITAISGQNITIDADFSKVVTYTAGSDGYIVLVENSDGTDVSNKYPDGSIDGVIIRIGTKVQTANALISLYYMA